jgi:hypothetical protein
MKHKQKRTRYNERLVPMCYRIPLSVESALTVASIQSGRTKVSLLIEALQAHLPSLDSTPAPKVA